MAEKIEDTNDTAPGTEFERSIARSSASSSTGASRSPTLVDGDGDALVRDGKNAASDQLQALKTELDNLKHSVASIANTARDVASEKVDMTVADVEEALKRNVFASVAVAALAGYLWGRTR